MSLREALLRCFQNEPNRIFGIQDLCAAVQKYYTFTEFQKADDPKHPQPRYAHEIRSQIARLKKERIIDYLNRDQYKLA
jgi:hypothetical protein